MKIFSRKVLSVLVVGAVLITNITSASIKTVVAATGFMASGGWYESAYAEWAPDSGVSSYTVQYKTTSDPSYKTADKELIRINKDTGNYRVDIPGLLGNTDYNIKVIPNAGASFETTITTMKHDRSGYAHFNYTEGVGAYKDDGTPKDNAIIVYVTQENKNTVTIPGHESTKGIGRILGSQSIMGAVTDVHPLIIRIIGIVNGGTKDERWLDEGMIATELIGLTAPGNDDNGYMANIRNAKNLTIEGIGYNAMIFGWGIGISQNGGKNYEIRNLSFKNYPEDAIGIQGSNSLPIERVWIHNNTFYSGLCENDISEDQDKGFGDGSCDFKRGQYYTLSYNYFENAKKTGLIGGNDTDLSYNITFHHNWWNKCGSRTPLVRQANIHIYNNYYQGNTSQTIDARAKAYVFSEANYFESCANVFDTTRGESGAVIKSFNDTLYNSYPKSGTVYKIAASREENVANGCKYPDFDTNPTTFYYDSINKKSAVTRLTDSITAKEEAKTYSGTMKPYPSIKLSFKEYGGKEINVSDLRSGITIISEFDNITGEDIRYSVMAVLYDNNRIVGGAVKIRNGIIKPSKTEVLTLTVNVPANVSNPVVKVMVWDRDNQRPLYPVCELK